MATAYIIRQTRPPTSWLPRCLLQPRPNSGFSSFSFRSKCTEHLMLQSEPSPQSISCSKSPGDSPKQWKMGLFPLKSEHCPLRCVPSCPNTQCGGCQICLLLISATRSTQGVFPSTIAFIKRARTLAHCLPTQINVTPSVRPGLAELMYTFNLPYSDSL